MKILGIHDGHNASACIIVQGKIIRAIEEERFTRIKGDCGFPANAIKYILKELNITADDLDHVVFGTLDCSYILHATRRYPDYSVKDFLFEMEQYWRPFLAGEFNDDNSNSLDEDYNTFKSLKYLDVMVGYDRRDESVYPISKLIDPENILEKQLMRKNYLSKFLSYPVEKISFIDHHECHAMHAYYSSPFREDALILTADGIGDGVNASVNTIVNGKFKCIFKTNTCNIGRIYMLVTLILRMKPAEHEFKVMGMAPYAKDHMVEEVYRIFQDTIKVEGLDFIYKNKITNHFDYFSEKLDSFRFDAIAGGLQKWAEELLVKWTKNCIKNTGIKKLVFSGGTALNIKACKLIAELPEVDDFFSPFAGSDQSISIGAAQKYYYDNNKAEKLIYPKSAYLGPGFDLADIEEVLNDSFVQKNFEIYHNVSPEDIALILIQGEIMGIMIGDSEFGPRALGHRSLIADPRTQDTVRKINKAIKNRDFWMPFTPSIIKERATDYLINPKNLKAPFMTVAFDSTIVARNEIIAGLHPEDFTVRPQIVDQKTCQKYYAIIKAFENKTGVGAVLNTSLNIHGKPIVLKPIDAVNDLLRSKAAELNYLLVEDVLLKRK
ncbi:carbamoyltransferase [bacterium]|nr:carbamoyltransferase [bacterium]